MSLALAEAAAAGAEGEVPVGAVLVVGGEVAGVGRNATRAVADPSAHAELLALRAAAAKAGDWRVGGTLYVTLEPCAMCAGALVLGRVRCVVFGARDPKAGMVVSLGGLLTDPRLNHRCAVREGVLAEEASALLSRFFRERRPGSR
ncbi:MAG: nucleoside deaminase [Gemmatimonadetes bacterium]|nr:nucleoside deaminase [Gemmatimonadota bacterium]